MSGLLLAVTALAALGQTGPYLVPLVAIDPGHGGEADGAVGVCGVREKEVTLDIGVELARLLEASGRVRTLLTRTGDLDVDLEERARMANEAGAALLVSIHANAAPSSRSHGVEVFFLSSRAATGRIRHLVERENEGRSTDEATDADPVQQILRRLGLAASHAESQRLALRLHERLANDLHAPARGVMQAPFVVLRAAAVPSVLVEVGFLSNADECRILGTREHRRGIARSLATSILSHLANEPSMVARWGP